MTVTNPSDLFNPVFCGIMIHSALREYCKHKGEGMPFPLVFLILPFTLPERVRDTVTNRTLLKWGLDNPCLLHEVPSLIQKTYCFTQQSLFYLLSEGYIEFQGSL